MTPGRQGAFRKGGGMSRTKRRRVYTQAAPHLDCDLCGDEGEDADVREVVFSPDARYYKLTKSGGRVVKARKNAISVAMCFRCRIEAEARLRGARKGAR